LQVLNIKGNIIGDEGCKFLAESLHHNDMLKTLDISLNEIGQQGFDSLCTALETSELESLHCSKNYIGDEILAKFSNIIAEKPENGSLA
jgi:Ran GTPase-activating protein (RanGAP) involved in mRNA processing and transport